MDRLVERTNFEHLEVYQVAEKLADVLWGIVLHWDAFSRSTMGAQIVRAADSIPANLAEGSGRGTVRGKRHFVRISRGSLYETRNWLRRAFRRKLLQEAEIQELQAIMESLSRLMNAYCRSIQ